MAAASDAFVSLFRILAAPRSSKVHRQAQDWLQIATTKDGLVAELAILKIIFFVQEYSKNIFFFNFIQAFEVS